jgi:hypothetical protein
MQTSRKDRDRAPVGVICRVHHELIIERQRDALHHAHGIVRLKDVFAAIIQLPIPNQNSQTACGKKGTLIRRQTVRHTGNSDSIIGAPPSLAVDHRAECQAVVDIRERRDFYLTVVPAPTSEDTNVIGQGRSNLVGCWTGRSPGFSPLRIRSA